MFFEKDRKWLKKRPGRPIFKKIKQETKSLLVGIIKNQAQNK